jgi:hypothetical protein
LIWLRQITAEFEGKNMTKIRTAHITTVTLILLSGCSSPQETEQMETTETEMYVSGKIVDPDTGVTNESITINGKFVQNGSSMVMYVDTNNIPPNTSVIDWDTPKELVKDGQKYQTTN